MSGGFAAHLRVRNGVAVELAGADFRVLFGMFQLNVTKSEGSMVVEVDIGHTQDPAPSICAVRLEASDTTFESGVSSYSIV